MSLFAKLKRRNVFRSALAYAVAAWLLVEVMELITGTFAAPPWVLKVFLSVLVIGIVPVMIFSWLYEITPEGIKRESTDHPEHTAGTARKLDIAVLVMLTVAIGLFVQDRFSREAPAARTPADVSAAAPAPVMAGPPMVAVLPFESTSLEGDSEFFAIGVHDDLLTQLAKLESMRVISRTSVLEYRDTVRNLREIGAALGADAILEGGVQTAGNRIRINAQLIDAHTDEHLWGETYNRELSPQNIFDVQAEIARAIASALNATLTTQDTQQLTSIPTENMAAYRAFRRAMQIRDSGRRIFDPEYVPALEEAVALDPTFSRAWAELVGALAARSVGEVTLDPELALRVERALKHIQTISPGSAEYLIAQTYYIYYILRDYEHAHAVVSQALARNPSDIQVLELKSWIERRQGALTARTETLRELAMLDPGNPMRASALVDNLFVSHNYDEALAEALRSGLTDDLMAGNGGLVLLKEEGDFGRWLESMQAIHRDYENANDFELWIAYIANRDYAGAVQQFGGVEQQVQSESDYLSFDAMMAIWTHWLMDEQSSLQEDLVQARELLENQMDANGDFDRTSSYLEMALVNAAEGDAEESMRLVRQWDRLATDDKAERLRYWQFACTVIAMNKDTSDTVECLRTGLEEPSYVTPFLTPYTPFYDSMREDPMFIEFLDEISEAFKQ